MKKLTALLMSVMLTLGLFSCSQVPVENDDTASDSVQHDQTTNADTNSTDTTPDTDNNDTDTTDDTGTTDNSKVLVVYYSASGNTEGAAKYIAAATNGDIFELVPVDDYTNADLNYSDSNSRVVYEHDHPDERNIDLTATTVDNWDEYDTIFIGYPIWWHIAAWPIDGFVKANDFTGKTVIPFCTSASSGLGDSGKLLAEMAGTGDWLEGMRFSSRVSEDDVRTWVESLELNG